MHVNAFSISWQDRPFYAFPPFAAIGKMLHNIVLDVATGIIAVLNWSTQPWCSLLMKLLIDFHISIHSSKTHLQHHAKSKPHALANKLNLLACMISGKTQEQQTFQQRALGSSSRVGIPQQPKDMTTTFGNGKWSHFNIFRSAHWIPNQHFWIQCRVLISRHNKISHMICYHYGQWDIIWETSPCSAFYERYI